MVNVRSVPSVRVLTARARPTRALRKAAAVWAALALSVVAVAGCTPIEATTKAEAPQAQGVALKDTTPQTDPKSYVGPSTALVTGESPIAPDSVPEPQLPVTVTDMQGTEVTVTDTSRILALDVYGTTSRIVYRLGLGDSLVGRDTSTNFPEVSHLPNVTPAGHDLSAEAILDLSPSVIITDTSLGPWDVILQMRDAGIPVVVVDSYRSIENTPTMIRQVADALGVSDEGAALADQVEQETADKIAEIATIAPAAQKDKLRVAFLYIRGGSGVYYMFGSDSGADTLIESLGAIDVASEIGWSGMKPVNSEGIIAAAPDVILTMTKGLDSTKGVDGLLEALPELAHTPAGVNKRIVDMDDTTILSYGPATAEVLDALAVALYAPDAHALTY